MAERVLNPQTSLRMSDTLNPLNPPNNRPFIICSAKPNAHSEKRLSPKAMHLIPTNETASTSKNEA